MSTNDPVTINASFEAPCNYLHCIRRHLQAAHLRRLGGGHAAPGMVLLLRTGRSQNVLFDSCLAICSAVAATKSFCHFQDFQVLAAGSVAAPL